MKNLTLAAIAVTSSLMASSVALAEDSASAKSGTLKVSSADSKFTFNGRLMFDWDSFDGAHNISNNGDNGTLSEIRRARFAVSSQLNKDWKGKLQVNFDEKKQADIKDAYIQRHGQSATLTIGKHKEPMGLEELTSSKYISTIERSMVTDAFAPSRSIGISLKGSNGKLLWQGGVFRSEKDADNSKKETYALTGRAVFTPYNEPGDLLHFGMAFSSRDAGNNDYSFNERAEIHTADKIVSSATVNADKINLYDIEAAWVKNNFSVQAEYYSADITANQGEDASFDGFYVLGSYLLTGEHRPYKSGSFGKVKPNSADGAWEIVLRYSSLDGRDNGTGVLGKNTTFGANYYMSPSMRMMFNYISTDLESDTVLAEDTGSGISLRFQYIW